MSARNSPEIDAEKAEGQDSAAQGNCGEKCDAQELLCRWWFSKDICPLIYDALGPMATVFIIPALLNAWVILEGEKKGRNPTWLKSLLIFCAVSGLLSTAASFFHRFKLFPFAGLECVALIGLTFPAITLITSLILAKYLEHEFFSENRIAFSQSFFYAIISAALYSVAALCFIFRLLGQFRRLYPRKRSVDSLEASIFYKATGLMVYLLLGAVIFANIEGWTYQNALYWADFTILTIGVGGQFTPKTKLGRSLLLPYALAGIVTVASLVNSIQKVAQRGRKRLRSHLTETRRVRTIRCAKPRARDTPWSTWQVGEEAFNLARKVCRDAEGQCRLISFWLSCIAGVSFFLIGAGVFTITEQEQHWSYGISLYFAYITILTIGYGDYQPKSESGKPFFVVWTLLAVPVLTVLTSNSVEAVHKLFARIFSGCGGLIRRRRGRTMSGSGKPLDNAGVSGGTYHGAAVMSECISSTENVQPRIEGGESSDRGAAKRALIVEKNLTTQRNVLTHQLLQLIPHISVNPQEFLSFEEWTSYLKPIMSHHVGLKEKGLVQEREWHADSSACMTAEDCKLFQIEINWLGQDSPIFAENEAKWIGLKLARRLEILNCC